MRAKIGRAIAFVVRTAGLPPDREVPVSASRRECAIRPPCCAALIEDTTRCTFSSRARQRSLPAGTAMLSVAHTKIRVRLELEDPGLIVMGSGVQGPSGLL